MNNHKILKFLYRSDFYAFMQKSFYEIDNSQPFMGNWHLELICDKLQQCANGKIKRLIINIPPRNLKSHCASICLPAFILGHNPKARIVCVSYAQTLAENLSRKTRQLMESDFYKTTFKTRLEGKNTENEFETSENGFRYATSIDGSLTGLGGNFIIIDDPIKADDALSDTIRTRVNNWYDNTLVSRLNDKVNGVIVVIMQRLHIDDLTGHLLKQDGWEVLSLASIAEKDERFTLSNGKMVGRKAQEALNPSLESVDILNNQRKLMNEYNFSAQYQQNPIPLAGNIINYDWFAQFSKFEIPVEAKTIQSWDIALKDGKNNDYSVCITAKIFETKLYITDIQRFKLDLPALASKIEELYVAENCNHLVIEESSVSLSLIQYLKKVLPVSFISYKPKGNKISRANSVALYIKSKDVLLAEDAKWLDEFRAEINAFPNGKHDDQVDALTQLIDSVKSNQYNCTLETLAKAIKEHKEKGLSVNLLYSSAREFCQFAMRQIKYQGKKTSNIKRSSKQELLLILLKIK